MVFKMLILLGFLADAAGPFIHSDIHRGMVQIEGKAVHRIWVSRTFLRLGRAQMSARNTLFSAHWNCVICEPGFGTCNGCDVATRSALEGFSGGSLRHRFGWCSRMGPPPFESQKLRVENQTKIA